MASRRLRPAQRITRARHSRTRGGQGLVEFALVAPLLVLVVFLTIDFGRLVYTYNAIASASREGARLVALPPAESSDCDALHRMEVVGQAFPLTQDPNSMYQDSDPNVTSAPPAGVNAPTPGDQIPQGQGYIYIYPAAADSLTQCDGHDRQQVCQNNTDCPGTQASVQIEYAFVPITPIVRNMFPRIVVRTVSVVDY
jgi:hypothetical protein